MLYYVVKEVLNDVAVYIQRGPYKNLYQLKDEFKLATGSGTDGPQSTDNSMKS